MLGPRSIGPLLHVDHGSASMITVLMFAACEQAPLPCKALLAALDELLIPRCLTSQEASMEDFMDSFRPIPNHHHLEEWQHKMLQRPAA